MAATNTLRSEVAENLFGFAFAGLHRSFKRCECADPDAAGTAAADVSSELSVCASTYASVAGFAVSLDAPVAGIFGLRADAKVAAPIVKPVAVDVIDNKSAIIDAKDQPVHQNELSFTNGVPHIGCRIEGVGVNTKFGAAPCVWREHIDAIVIDKRDATVVQRDDGHYCSFDNALSSVAASSKVLGFGDQPSRDG